MLLEFTVENFRSIADPVTLSAVAQSRASKQGAKSSRSLRKSDDDIALPYEVPGRDLKVLPVLAIFGANASGKTNVIQALDYLLSLMSFGNRSRDMFTCATLTPFLLSSDTIDRPTRFEISMVFDSDIYTYSLALTSKRILEEKLEYSPSLTKRNRLCFHRLWDFSIGKYKWRNGDHFRGPHLQLQAKIDREEPFIGLIVRQLDLENLRSLDLWLKSRLSGVKIDEEKYSRSIMAEVFTAAKREGNKN